VLEEVVVPCLGQKLEEEIFPALSRALFTRDLEAMAGLLRSWHFPDDAKKKKAERDWEALRNDVLFGQIDYQGKGPLPEHWKQFIDKEANLFDWRHPKWAQDAEALVVDLAVEAASRENWNGEMLPSGKTGAGLLELLMELGEAVPEARALSDKFLEGMPEWLQHDNAYTGGYLREDEVAKLLAIVEPKADDLERTLKAGPLVPGCLALLKRASAEGVGLTWTVPMLRA
jgi:hypothetical protein